ncbi:hypothetical protein BD414DRAFT_536287 [Trametes punicea]|nr:hypothetical protein BD414DRAFT_536287 [Trametes punicea]
MGEESEGRIRLRLVRVRVLVLSAFLGPASGRRPWLSTLDSLTDHPPLLVSPRATTHSLSVTFSPARPLPRTPLHVCFAPPALLFPLLRSPLRDPSAAPAPVRNRSSAALLPSLFLSAIGGDLPLAPFPDLGSEPSSRFLANHLSPPSASPGLAPLLPALLGPATLTRLPRTLSVPLRSPLGLSVSLGLD